MKRIAVAFVSLALLLPVCVGGPNPAMQNSPGGKQETRQGGIDVGNKRTEEHHQSDNDQDVSGHHNLVLSFNGEEAGYVAAAVAFLIFVVLVLCRRLRRAEWSANTMIDAIEYAKNNGGKEAADTIITYIKAHAAERAPIHRMVAKRKGRR